jgi:hypothetical protein
MKKTLSLLVIVVLAACLMSFAFGRMTPAIHFISDTQRIVSGPGLAAPPAMPSAFLAQPVAVVVTGLVCGLFGLLALAPLLLNEPGR